MGYAGKRLNPTYALAVKPLYLNTAAACLWIPACAGMTVSEETLPLPRHPRAGGDPEGVRALQPVTDTQL